MPLVVASTPLLGLSQLLLGPQANIAPGTTFQDAMTLEEDPEPLDVDQPELPSQFLHSLAIHRVTAFLPAESSDAVQSLTKDEPTASAADAPVPAGTVDASQLFVFALTPVPQPTAVSLPYVQPLAERGTPAIHVSVSSTPILPPLTVMRDAPIASDSKLAFAVRVTADHAPVVAPPRLPAPVLAWPKPIAIEPPADSATAVEQPELPAQEEPPATGAAAPLPVSERMAVATQLPPQPEAVPHAERLLPDNREITAPTERNEQAAAFPNARLTPVTPAGLPVKTISDRMTFDVGRAAIHRYIEAAVTVPNESPFRRDDQPLRVQPVLHSATSQVAFRLEEDSLLPGTAAAIPHLAAALSSQADRTPKPRVMGKLLTMPSPACPVAPQQVEQPSLPLPVDHLDAVETPRIPPAAASATQLEPQAVEPEPPPAVTAAPREGDGQAQAPREKRQPMTMQPVAAHQDTESSHVPEETANSLSVNGTPAAMTGPQDRSGEMAGSKPASPPRSVSVYDSDLDVQPLAVNQRPLTLQVKSAEGQVQVQLRDRGGKLHVAVRSTDSDLAIGLRQELGSLVHRLEKVGFHSETWVPDAASATDLPRLEADSAPSGDTPQSGGGERDPSQESGHQSPHQRHRPKWLTAFQDGTEDLLS